MTQIEAMHIALRALDEGVDAYYTWRDAASSALHRAIQAAEKAEPTIQQSLTVAEPSWKAYIAEARKVYRDYLDVQEAMNYLEQVFIAAPAHKPLSDEQIEFLAVQYEAFGFGRVDAIGATTHGFDPDGLLEFARAIEREITK